MTRPWLRISLQAMAVGGVVSFCCRGRAFRHITPL